MIKRVAHHFHCNWILYFKIYTGAVRKAAIHINYLKAIDIATAWLVIIIEMISRFRTGITCSSYASYPCKITSVNGTLHFKFFGIDFIGGFPLKIIAMLACSSGKLQK